MTSFVWFRHDTDIRQVILLSICLCLPILCSPYARLKSFILFSADRVFKQVLHRLNSLRRAVTSLLPEHTTLFPHANRRHFSAHVALYIGDERFEIRFGPPAIVRK